MHHQSVGMTGVGKPPVSRLVGLSAAPSFVRFDRQSGKWASFAVMPSADCQLTGKSLPSMNFSTPEPSMNAASKYYGDRIIWDLLDSGMVHSFSGGPKPFRVRNSTQNLRA